MTTNEVRVEYDGAPLPKLKDPVLVEGLSGVGNVGLLAAEQMAHALQGQRIGSLYSPYFTYSMSTIPGIESREGVAELLRDDLYAVPRHNLLLLVGPYQGSVPESFYHLAQKILDLCDRHGCRRLVALGGYGVGRVVEKPHVYAVASHPPVLQKAIGLGATEMRAGMVTGVSGLLLALARERDKEALCLLGETHGSYPDPKGAEATLGVLDRYLDIRVDARELQEKQKLLEEELRRGARAIRQIAEAKEEAQQEEEESKKDELRYIG